MNQSKSNIENSFDCHIRLKRIKTTIVGQNAVTDGYVGQENLIMIGL